MAIRKTVAGTFEVDFRDQHKKRLQRTFDTHRDAVAFQKEALAQIAKRDTSGHQKRPLVTRLTTGAAGEYRRASLVDCKNTWKLYQTRAGRLRTSVY
jgi:hypothetical protein